jgi:hypothetical protein
MRWALDHQHELTSPIRWRDSTGGYIVATLGDIGDERDLTTLRSLANDRGPRRPCARPSGRSKRARLSPAERPQSGQVIHSRSGSGSRVAYDPGRPVISVRRNAATRPSGFVLPPLVSWSLAGLNQRLPQSVYAGSTVWSSSPKLHHRSEGRTAPVPRKGAGAVPVSGRRKRTSRAARLIAALLSSP